MLVHVPDIASLLGKIHSFWMPMKHTKESVFQVGSHGRIAVSTEYMNMSYICGIVEHCSRNLAVLNGDSETCVREPPFRVVDVENVVCLF